jgi:hypothetical protein
MDSKRILKPVTAVAMALGLATSMCMASAAQAAGQQHSPSGNTRPIMPGNQPAGTSLNQKTPGASMAPPDAKKPATSQAAPATSVPSPSSGSSSSSPLTGQGTVQGSKGAPQLGGPTLPGGTAGSRGAKDGIGGH